jgi:hypothetical protein
VWAKAQREACLINDTGILRGHMNNKIVKSETDIAAQTQLTNQRECTKKQKSQDKKQKFLQRIIAVSFVVQAVLIGVKGNLDVLSGKPVLDVIQGMIAQGVSLIVKAAKESESKPRSKK